MAKKKATEALFKKILRQISGELASDEEFLPEFIIIGSGHIWCWDPNARKHIPIVRGAKIFMIQKKYDYLGRSLVYTITGELICIEEEEITPIGFD